MDTTAIPLPRRGKTYGEGPCIPLDRNAKARISVYARAWNARHRRPGQHLGPLTRTTLDILRAILWGFHNAHTGRCFPSYEAIAAKAPCHRDSVRVAIQALEAAGILSWVHRLAIIRDPCIDAMGATVWHPRTIRTSNAYAFIDPQTSSRPSGMASPVSTLAALRTSAIPGDPAPRPLHGPDPSKTENPAGTLYQDNFDSFLPAGPRPLDPTIPGEAALIALNQRLAASLG